ncbi:MAG: hypothetical protein EBR91_11880, partial [Flavobacteriia bacterium]|nr:hypothetical protein [Flavobacteriia bacterium]
QNNNPSYILLTISSLIKVNSNVPYNAYFPGYYGSSAICQSLTGLYQLTINGNSGWLSSNSGITWASTNLGQDGPVGIGMSKDGKYQYIAGINGTNTGHFRSTDYGVTFTRYNPGAGGGYNNIAVSSTGQYVITTYGSTTNIQLLLSSNYGASWSNVGPNNAPVWSGAAISSTGQYGSTCTYGGYIYISSDYCLTWSPVATVQNWKCIGMSDSGQYQSAAVNNGYIYISNNYGVSWSPVTLSGYAWSSISVGNSGANQVISVNGGYIYLSTNYGVTWSPITNNSIGWSAISIQDAGFIIAVGSNGIYELNTATINQYNYTNNLLNYNIINYTTSSGNIVPA